MNRISIVILLLIFDQNVNSQNLADSASYYTSEYDVISKEQGNTLWGRPIGAPILFIDKNKGLAYLSQSSGDTNEVIHGNIFILPLDSEMMVTQPIVDWRNEQWVAVYLPYQQSKRRFIEFIAHESFHCVQDEFSIQGISYGIPHLSTIQGKTLTQIELIELLKAFKSESDYEKRRDHILNALVLRKYRHKQFPDARLLEGKAELSEGLAEYTGMTYAGYSQQDLIDHYQKSIKQLETRQMEAMYPYISGSMYAFLNDRKDSAWRKSIPNSFVDEITASIYNIKIEEEQENSAIELLKSSEYIRIPDLFGLSTAEGLKEIFSKNRFFLSRNSPSFQFRSNLIVSIPDVGTVYNNITVNDEWGVLEVKESGRALISSDDYIILSNDSLEKNKQVVEGMGWKLRINSGWIINNVDDDQYLIKTQE